MMLCEGCNNPLTDEDDTQVCIATGSVMPKKKTFNELTWEKEMKRFMKNAQEHYYRWD